jgi:hypothetical protein
MTTIYEKNAASITWRQLYLTLVDFLLAKYFHMRSTRKQLATTRWQFHNNPGNVHSDGSGGSIVQWTPRGGDCALPRQWRLP